MKAMPTEFVTAIIGTVGALSAAGIAAWASIYVQIRSTRLRSLRNRYQAALEALIAFRHLERAYVSEIARLDSARSPAGIKLQVRKILRDRGVSPPGENTYPSRLRRELDHVSFQDTAK